MADGTEAGASLIDSMRALADGSRLSLVIAVHNGRNYLAEALESVFAQARRPDEIILVDDGSTDDTVAIAARYGQQIRTVRQAQAGTPAARNRGLTETSGDLIAFLDHDDLLPPDSLALRLEALMEHDSIAYVFGVVERFVSPELELPSRSRLPANAPEIAGRIAGATMFRRQAFAAIGGFTETLRGGYMIDWMGRAEAGGLCYRAIDTCVLRRRIHADNYVHDIKALEQNYLDALRMVVRQRKVAGGPQ